MRAQRVVVPAAELAGVSSRDEVCTTDAVRLGVATGGTDVWLIRFPTPWGTNGPVERAFLILFPAHTSSPDPVSAALEVRRIEAPWSAATMDSHRLPQLSGAVASVLPIHHRSDAPVRIDVTSTVRRWQKAPGENHGLAVMAQGGTGWGAVYSAGAALGLAPRLDVYLH